jgi:hypothetical protein
VSDRLETPQPVRGLARTIRPATTHLIVLPGGGYSAHSAQEAEPVTGWLAGLGLSASVFRYPLNVRHPAPLLALRSEIQRRREQAAGSPAALPGKSRQLGP